MGKTPEQSPETTVVDAPAQTAPTAKPLKSMEASETAADAEAIDRLEDLMDELGEDDLLGTFYGGC